MPENWVKNKCLGNVWLTGLRKCHQFLGLRNPEAAILNRLTSFDHENMTIIFENLKTIMSRNNFTVNKIHNLYKTGSSTVYVPNYVCLLQVREGQIS
jgi:hypothetical protein